MRLLDPSGGFSLAAGVDMGRLSLALRLQLELRLPLSPWRWGGTGGADRRLLYARDGRDWAHTGFETLEVWD